MRYLLYTRPKANNFAVHDTLGNTWSRYCFSIKSAAANCREYTISTYDVTTDSQSAYIAASSDTPYFTPENFPELYI